MGRDDELRTALQLIGSTIDPEILRDLYGRLPGHLTGQEKRVGLELLVDYNDFLRRAGAVLSPAFVPGTPARYRPVLRRGWEADVLDRWEVYVGVPITVTAIFYTVMALASEALPFSPFLVLPLAVFGVALAATPAVRQRRRRRRWAGSVISVPEQAVVQARPALGVRLVHASLLIKRLRDHEAITGGLLGLTGEELDDIHHRIVSVLVDAVGLSEAVAEAADTQELADRVRDRQDELSAVYAAVDDQIGRLKRVLAHADSVLDSHKQVLDSHQQVEHELAAQERRSDRIETLAGQLDDQHTPLARLELPDPADDALRRHTPD